MAVVEAEEVDMLISSPDSAQGTRWSRRTGTNHTFMQRIHLFSSLPTSQFVGSCSSRHNYWTDRRSSYCENSRRIWSGSCDSTNLQTWVTHVVISRETPRFVTEIHTHEARTISSGELIARKSSRIQRNMSYKQRQVTTCP